MITRDSKSHPQEHLVPHVKSLPRSEETSVHVPGLGGDSMKHRDVTKWACVPGLQYTYRVADGLECLQGTVRSGASKSGAGEG